MSWNDSNNNNNNNKDPWKRQQQPDLDEVVRRLQERFGSLFGGIGALNNRDPNNNSGDTSSFLITLLLIIASAIWGFSGFYMVAADEQAVVLRFGKHIDTTKPGWGYHLPYPIETVEKLPVTRIQRVEVGFNTLSDGRIRKVDQESLMLTKDENIVDISFIVQYKIKNVAQYLFNIDRGMKTVRDVAESAIREEIGRTIIDDVLTTKKAEVEIAVEVLIQDILDSYESGIAITTVKLQDVQPPERVIREFKDVASAREDR
ncbi:MAG: protease modulator HflK, partial [Mariprofundales bacterium]